MLEILGTLIGIGLAYLASKWSYGQTLLNLAKEGLAIAKSTGLDMRIPENVRKVAEQAIIEANQRQVEKIVERLMQAQAESELAEQRALERGRELHEQYFTTELIEPTGDEPTHKPFAHLNREE